MKIGLVVSRVLYLSHFYLWLSTDRHYTLIETTLAITGTAVAAPLFAYAILRQKVFDLGFALNRTLVYGIISGGLLITFGLIEWGVDQLLPHERLQASAFLSAAVALAIFLVFHRIRDFVETNVERLLFRSWHENEARLRRWVKEAAFVEKPEALVSATVVAVARFAVGADCALYRREGEAYLCGAGGVTGVAVRIDSDDRMAITLRADRHPVDPAETGSTIAAVLALPMSHRAELEGFILLGKKPSGDSYRPDEIELLGWAAQQIGLDIHALKVSRLERGMSSLRMRVEELQKLLTVKAKPQPIVATIRP